MKPRKRSSLAGAASRRGRTGHAKASTTPDTYAKLWSSGEDRTRRGASSLAQQVLGEEAGEIRAGEQQMPL